LGDIELPGCLAEAAEFGYLDEILELS